jgi:hypothetical protein
MKVSELREKINSWESEGKVKDQTVEFIINSKKHFVSDVKAGANTMTFDVTRSQYTPLTVESLRSNLSISSGDTTIKITQNAAEKSIEDLYLSSDFLEFILA